jgi:uncharacterized protein (TIGR00369 family)
MHQRCAGRWVAIIDVYVNVNHRWDRAMKPHDDAYAQRTRDSFARQAAMATLGAELAEVGPGRVAVRMPHREDLTQQHGYLHAGIVATGLDTACGYAAFTLMPPDAAVLTIEFKINLLAPARGPRFRFEGTVVKPGRTISVVEGRALQFDAGEAGEGRLVATMTATVMTVVGRDIRH